MSYVKIPYTRVRGGVRYFEPSKAMKAAGFHAKPCGPEGAQARAEALRLYGAWEMHRNGILAAPAPGQPISRDTAEIARQWPPGSIGAAFVAFMRLPEWSRLARSTRDRDILPSWSYIRDAWGDCDPNLMTLDLLSEWRADLVEKKGPNIAHKVFKEWRRHWRVMTALGVATRPDPSLAIRNNAPAPRNETWREGEAVRLVKEALRSAHPDALSLAAAVAVAWDTQFSPVDVYTIRARHLVRIGGRIVIDKSADGRAKTKRAIIGTLSRRTERILSVLLARTPDMHPEALVFMRADGRAWNTTSLGEQFRLLVEKVFPGDKRQLRDFRRSGTVEAFAGGADAEGVAAKMGNSIDRSNTLWKTYNPVSLEAVRRADMARVAGRQKRRERD